jgi:hypothetical protein
LNTTATPNSDTAAAVPHDDASPDNRLQPALSLLDAIIADRDVMEAWPAADRERLLQAVALVHHPEPRARRRKSKDLARRHPACTHCYVCKQKYCYVAEVHAHPPLLRPDVPDLRGPSTSSSAPRPPTCAGAWRCSPAAASRSATRPA